MQQPKLLIYHSNCTDGFTAAWAARKRWPDAELCPAKHGEAAPDVTGREVVMLDFSFKRPIIEDMLTKCVSLHIYDHHKSAVEELDGIEHPKFYPYFDMLRSGAGIAWDELVGGPRPWLVDVIEDVDIWRWTVPNSKSLIESIRSYSWTMEAWEAYSMIEKDGEVYQQMVNEGDAILRAKKQQIAMACEFAIEVEIEGNKVLASNVPYFLSSEVGNKLIQDRAFGVTYYFDGKWRLSFRSDDRADYDVSALARRLGGGGHRHASGAEVEKLPWE